MIDKDLAMARAAASRLSERLDAAPAFDESVAREYNRAKRALAVAFQRMALVAAAGASARLEDVKAAITTTMANEFQGLVDSSLLTVRRYTSPHPQIYGLLATHVGDTVPAWRVRLVAADQVHTERRTRELRDLGLRIEVAGSDDEATYLLEAIAPDLLYGAAFQLRANALRSRRITDAMRNQAVHVAESTVDLPLRKAAPGAA